MSSTIDDPELLAREQALAAGSAEAHEADADGDAEEEESQAATGRRFLLFAAVPSWAISMIVHVIGIVMLAFVTFSPTVAKVANVINAANASDVEEIEEFEMLEEIVPLEVSEVSNSEEVVQSTVDTTSEVVEVEVSTDVDAAAISVDLIDFSTETAPRNDLMKEIGSMTGSALEGRSAKARGQMVKQSGGSEGSEKAVAMALKSRQNWASHRRPYLRSVALALLFEASVSSPRRVTEDSQKRMARLPRAPIHEPPRCRAPVAATRTWEGHSVGACDVHGPLRPGSDRPLK